MKTQKITEEQRRNRQIAANLRELKRAAQLHAEQVAFHASKK